MKLSQQDVSRISYNEIVRDLGGLIHCPKLRDMLNKSPRNVNHIAEYMITYGGDLYPRPEYNLEDIDPDLLTRYIKSVISYCEAMVSISREALSSSPISFDILYVEDLERYYKSLGYSARDDHYYKYDSADIYELSSNFHTLKSEIESVVGD